MGSYSIPQLVLQLTSKRPLAISLLVVQDRTFESDIFGIGGYHRDPCWYLHWNTIAWMNRQKLIALRENLNNWTILESLALEDWVNGWTFRNCLHWKSRIGQSKKRQTLAYLHKQHWNLLQGHITTGWVETCNTGGIWGKLNQLNIVLRQMLRDWIAD